MLDDVTIDCRCHILGAYISFIFAAAAKTQLDLLKNLESFYETVFWEMKFCASRYLDKSYNFFMACGNVINRHYFRGSNLFFDFSVILTDGIGRFICNENDAVLKPFSCRLFVVVVLVT